MSDYQSPTPAALSSFETLAAHAREDFELTKRAVIAAGFLGLDSSEANLTIDAYLKHQQKYGLQDPTGFASVTDLILFQHHLNTPGTIGLPDGSEEDRRGYVLSSEERIETLIAGADIWSWLALPERDLATVPEWFKQSYPGRGLRQQIAGGFPFSLNASRDIRFSAAPVFTDDEALAQSNLAGRRSDYENYNSLSWARQQHLDMLEIQPNATAKDLEALARGNLDNTTLYYSFSDTYKSIAIERLEFLLANKTEIISRLNVRDRAFSDDTGDLSLGATLRYNKAVLLQIANIHEVGAFRHLGLYFPVPDKDLMELPSTQSTWF